jgi:hypothetical protein
MTAGRESETKISKFPRMTAPFTNANQGWIVGFTRWFTVLICVGLAVGGGYVCWNGWKKCRLNADSTEWPNAEGKVARAYVKTYDLKASTRPWVQQHSQRFEVMVDYTFSAEGQNVHATSNAPRQVSDDEGQTSAQTIADSYAPGSTITVYYQPGNPKQSRLRWVEVSSSGWMWLWLIGGGVMVLGSLVWMWWMVRRYERRVKVAG